MEIVPSIIGQNFSEIEDKLAVLEGACDWAHLDIMDGRLTKSRSWQVASDLDFVPGRIKLEAHLMIKDPESVLSEWTRVVDKIIVQAEVVNNLKELLDIFANHHTKLSVSLLMETPVDILKPYLDDLKFVHLMSVSEIGFYGQPFNNAVLEKIKTLRALSPSVNISVDGGINLNNVKKVFAAGANRVIVGNAIWGEGDPLKNLEQFKKL